MVLIFSNRKEAVELAENETVNQLFKVSKAPAAIWPYSKAYFAWDLLFCSWQIWFDANTMKIVEWWIESEARQVCRNISYLLEENWLSLKDVVKTTIFLKHIKEDKHFLTGTVPFFNPERLFISLKYESQTFKIRV